MVGGCSDVKFSGGGRSQDALPAAPVNKFINCESNENSTESSFEVSVGAGETPVTIAGQLCLGNEANLQSYHVALAIDNSASMSRIDPETDGSCKRHRAAQVLFKKLKDVFGENFDKNLELSLWLFSDNATPVVTPHRYLTPTEFEAQYLSAEVFCKVDGGQTNYEDIFTVVKDDLKENTKQKQLFVLTDGFPTSTNDPNNFCSSTIFDRNSVCAEKGAKAAQSFLGLSGSAIKILFLEETTASRQPDLEDYLKKDVTRNEGNVKFASKTEEVEASLNELSPSVTGTVGKAFMDATSTGVQVNLIRFDRLDDTTWEYDLQTLVSEPNETYNIDLVLKDEATGDPVGVDVKIAIKTVP